MSWAAHADPEMSEEARMGRAVVECHARAPRRPAPARFFAASERLQIWEALECGYWLCSGCQARVVGGPHPAVCERCLTPGCGRVFWRYHPPEVVS